MRTIEDCSLAQSKADVVSETIGGETIIVDLQNGRYYRLTGISSAVWTSLAQPARWADVLAAARSGAEAVAPGVVARLVGDLADVSLVVLDAEARQGLDRLAASAPPRAPGDPAVDSYDDMADLLMLDPVHDVGEQGWPARPPEAMQA